LRGPLKRLKRLVRVGVYFMKKSRKVNLAHFEPSFVGTIECMNK
jgi:hypothetical protein